VAAAAAALRHAIVAVDRSRDGVVLVGKIELGAVQHLLFFERREKGRGAAPSPPAFFLASIHIPTLTFVVMKKMLKPLLIVLVVLLVLLTLISTFGGSIREHERFVDLSEQVPAQAGMAPGSKAVVGGLPMPGVPGAAPAAAATTVGKCPGKPTGPVSGFDAAALPFAAPSAAATLLEGFAEGGEYEEEAGGGEAAEAFYAEDGGNMMTDAMTKAPEMFAAENEEEEEEAAPEAFAGDEGEEAAEVEEAFMAGAGAGMGMGAVPSETPVEMEPFSNGIVRRRAPRRAGGGLFA
jgi:hypothetical protein